MKKFILIFTFLFFSIGIFSQVSLIQSFNYSATIIKINETDYKYFLMDVPGEECRIYNTDFSLYKTIALDIPDGQWLYDIKFVSEDLFNSDTDIELLYTYYKWITTNASTGDGYYVYHTKIQSEKGSVLLDVPGALYSYIKETQKDEFKLFLYVYDYSLNPYTIKTNIYSLPGKLNTLMEQQILSAEISAFPNPGTDIINFHYSLPPDIKKARLILSDTNGNIQKTFDVDEFSSSLSISTNDISPGVYLYFLESIAFKSEAKKLFIQ